MLDIEVFRSRKEYMKLAHDRKRFEADMVMETLKYIPSIDRSYFQAWRYIKKGTFTTQFQSKSSRSIIAQSSEHRDTSNSSQKIVA